MVRSIATGKPQKAEGRRQKAADKDRCVLPTAYCLLPSSSRGSPSPRPPVSPSPGLRVPASVSRGFTLLELMIVISIIIILAAVVLPQYQKTITSARETVLRDDLFKMRSLIDQYAADKGKLPQSLDDLVSSGYMREIPPDPITGEKDWTANTGDDPNSTSGEQGMTDVHSSSPEISSDGRPYSEW